MNKHALLDVLAAKTELTKVDIAKAMDALIETVVETVAAGDPVVLVGLGTFKPAHRPQREGRNPATGEQLTIKETSLPKFAPGAAFKDAVAEAFRKRQAEKAETEMAAKPAKGEKPGAAAGKPKKKK
jgi:DNA-binding protein HU-beta